MKRTQLAAVIAFICLVISTTSNIQGQVNSSVRMVIAESNRLYGLAFTKNDPLLFVQRYSDEPCIMPQNNPSLCGRDAALTFYNISYNEMGVRNVILTTQEIFDQGHDYVTEMGIFQLFDAQGKVMFQGKYLVLWKNTSEGWKMHRDSFSRDSIPKVQDITDEKDVKYFTILLTRGEGWKEGKGMLQQELREHGKYMKKLHDEGWLTMAGPYVDEKGRLIILRVKSKKQAIDIINNDPGIQNKTFVAELREWTVRFNSANPD
jgi:uncharacterized protein YciI/ketosteroid isomerase-like protein